MDVFFFFPVSASSVSVWHILIAVFILLLRWWTPELCYGSWIQHGALNKDAQWHDADQHTEFHLFNSVYLFESDWCTSVSVLARSPADLRSLLIQLNDFMFSSLASFSMQLFMLDTAQATCCTLLRIWTRHRGFTTHPLICNHRKMDF